MKKKAFDACLEFIETEGWKDFSFAKVSQVSTIPLHVFYEQFQTPLNVMTHLFRHIDEIVLKNFDSVENLPPREALFDILMTRFEAAQPYKMVLQRFWEDWSRIPSEIPMFACQGLSSMAWMLEAAGLSTRGLKGCIRVQGLTTLYLLTLRTWLTDDTPDLGKTMVFLDKGLLKLEKAARFLNAF